MKTRLKKLVAILGLAVLTVTAVCGCGSKTEEAPPAETVEQETQAQPEKPEELVELTWYYLGEEAEENQEIFDAANAIIKEEINAVVNFSPISMGEYSEKMQLKASASEKFDLCYTADWAFTYYDNAKKGAFLDISSLMEEHAPETLKMIPEKIWNGAKIDGTLYAVPNYQVSFRQPCFVFKKELVEKYNLQEMIDSAQTLADLTPVLQTIKDNESGIIPSKISPTAYAFSTASYDNYHEMPLGTSVGIYVDKNLDVYDLTEGLPYEVRTEVFALSREWNQNGFYHPDAGITTDFSAEAAAGKFFMLDDVYKPGVEGDLEAKYGYPVYVKPMGSPVLSNGSICAALTAVSRTSENPEKAVELIELVNTNKELFNILVYGLEGKQYTKTSEDSIEISPDSKYTAYAWSMGCQFNAYRLPGQNEDVWEETMKLNEEAIESPMLGFYFDNSNVKTEIANLKTAFNEQSSTLTWGLSDDYAQIIADLKTVGEKDFEAVKAEMEKQLEGFKATK